MLIGTEELLTEKGPDYVAAVVASQRSKGLRDTGYSAENTRFTITKQGFTLTLSVVGPSYWRQQAYGRGPNKSRRPSKQMVQALKAWAVRHGMPEAAGYPIALNIARNGITVPNPFNPGGVIADALNPGMIASDLKSTLTPLIKQQVKALLFAP